MKIDKNKIAELVKRAKEKDHQAFEELYQITYKKLYFLTYTLLRNSQDAEDALQEVYIIIFNRIDTLKNDSYFLSWINKIAYNVSLNIIRESKIHHSSLMDKDMWELIPDERRYSNPYDSCVDKIEQEALVDLLKELDPIYSSAFVLKYSCGMKIKEIASAMECPEGTVKSRINKAKIIMKRNILEKKGNVLLSCFSWCPFTMFMFVFAKDMESKGKIEEYLNWIAFQLDRVQKTGIGQVTRYYSLPVAALGSLGVLGLTTFVSSSFDTIPSSMSVSISDQVDKQSVIAKVEVEMDSSQPRVYVASQRGDEYEMIRNEQGFYHLELFENGTYTFYVEDQDQVYLSEKAVVRSVDKEGPLVTNLSWDEGVIVVELKDEGSEIDYDSVYGMMLDGGKHNPIEVDREQGRIVFEFVKETFILKMLDSLGNQSEYKMEPYVIE